MANPSNFVVGSTIKWMQGRCPNCHYTGPFEVWNDDPCFCPNCGCEMQEAKLTTVSARTVEVNHESRTITLCKSYS